ncbi:MAG: S1C family serine protease [Mariniblastus sp.]
MTRSSSSSRTRPAQILFGRSSFTFSLCTFLFLALSVSVSHAVDNRAIEKLKEIQGQVSSVVSKNMSACVSITDGVGFGSGVIISEDGLVLTAGHVMASNDRGGYEIILPSGRTVKAKPLGKNLNADAGMVQILEPGPWPFVKIKKDAPLKKGQWVVSIGHSGGFELGRTPPVRTGRILDVKAAQILTDAVLIGGDSGGPLFDLDGKLIGIHSSIGDSVAENRHVTMQIFSRDWNRLKSGESWGALPELNEPSERKKRGIIGVRVDKSAANCLIKSVDPSGPAGQVGIEAGDVVTEFEKVIVQNGQHLIDIIKRHHAGEVCELKVLRDGKTIAFEVMLR